jgi:hypothetical protein
MTNPRRLRQVDTIECHQHALDQHLIEAIGHEHAGEGRSLPHSRGRAKPKGSLEEEHVGVTRDLLVEGAHMGAHGQ